MRTGASVVPAYRANSHLVARPQSVHPYAPDGAWRCIFWVGSHGRHASWIWSGGQTYGGGGGLIRAGHFILNPPCRQQATTTCSRRALFNSWRSCQRGPGVRLLHSQAPWGSSVASPSWPWPRRHVSDTHPASDGPALGIMLTSDSPPDSMGTVGDSCRVHGPKDGNHL